MIRIEVSNVVPPKERFGGPACHLRFGAVLGLDCNADDACMAAGGLLRALGPMYAGDVMKIVVWINERRVAQYVGHMARHGGAPEALAQFLESCRPYGWEWSCRRFQLGAWKLAA